MQALSSGIESRSQGFALNFLIDPLLVSIYKSLGFQASRAYAYIIKVRYEVANLIVNH